MDANEWQLIETAPRDGTRIIAMEGDGDVVLVDFYEGQWFLSIGHDPIDAPTHWVPLPAPPTNPPEALR